LLLSPFLPFLSGSLNDVAVIATVATDYVSQHSCFVPHRIPDNPRFTLYGLLMKRLFYRFIMQESQPPAMRAISIGDGGLIFANDCGEKVYAPYAHFMETSVPTGMLAKDDSRKAS
jgi:hypothetical protein